MEYSICLSHIDPLILHIPWIRFNSKRTWFIKEENPNMQFWCQWSGLFLKKNFASFFGASNWLFKMFMEMFYGPLRKSSIGTPPEIGGK